MGRIWEDDAERMPVLIVVCSPSQDGASTALSAGVVKFRASPRLLYFLPRLQHTAHLEVGWSGMKRRGVG